MPIAQLEKGDFVGGAFSGVLIESAIKTNGPTHVYEAFDIVAEQKLAVKLFDPKSLPEAQAEQEIELTESAGELDGVVDFISDGMHKIETGEEKPFVVTRFAERGTLYDYLRSIDDRGERLFEAVKAIGSVAHTLAELHDDGIIHADIKPENVVIDADGEVLICDFGIATEVGHVAANQAFLGTVGYIDPETMQGLPASTTRDIFALGSLAYHATTQRTPWVFSTVDQYVDAVAYRKDRIVHPRNIRPELPPILAGITMSALSYDALDRPGAHTFANCVDQALEELSTS